MFPRQMNRRWNDIWNGSYMNCGYEIKWSYGPRSSVNAIFAIARSRVQTPLKSWKFQVSLRNWNCVHHCDDHSFTWFLIRSSYMIHFIYHFIVIKLIMHSRYYFVEQYEHPRELNIDMTNLDLRGEQKWVSPFLSPLCPHRSHRCSFLYQPSSFFPFVLFFFPDPARLFLVLQSCITRIKPWTPTYCKPLDYLSPYWSLS